MVATPTQGQLAQQERACLAAEAPLYKLGLVKDELEEPWLEFMVLIRL